MEIELMERRKQRPGSIQICRLWRLGLTLATLWAFGPQSRGAASAPATSSLLTQPMSLADAVNLALRQNPNIIRAQKDLEVTEGVVIQTRAIALPKLGVIGDYKALSPGDLDTVPITIGGPNQTFTFGSAQSWAAQLKLVQSIYEGGRMVSSFRAARLLRDRSLLEYHTEVANTVLVVETAYYGILLAEQQITVQEASVALLERELTDATRRFEAGTVPRFNVLRAEVELGNAKPKLIQARNSFRIAKNNLATLLGINIPRDIVEDIPMQLTGKLEAVPYDLDLPRALLMALERRSELGALRKTQALRKEDVVSAKAGYKPSVQAFAGYDSHSSIFGQDLTVEVHGWLTGVQMTWSMFDGLLTQGKVKEAKALYEKAGVELDDTGRRIELDVRTAYSNFIESREVLESQKKVLEQAEEALRLARARNEAGTSTQLDVLSAQTALTDARSTQIQALHDYAVARARLERAVGANVPAQAEEAVKQGK
jgi:outer membrane protein TolC